MYISHFIYQFIHWWDENLECLYLLVFVNNTVMNTGVQYLLSYPFSFGGMCPKEQFLGHMTILFKVLKKLPCFSWHLYHFIFSPSNAKGYFSIKNEFSRLKYELKFCDTISSLIYFLFSLSLAFITEIKTTRLSLIRKANFTSLLTRRNINQSVCYHDLKKSEREKSII